MAEGRDRRTIHVYDCRSEDKQQITSKILKTSGLDFNGFLLLLHRKFTIRQHETFVLATTDRIVLDFDKFEELQDGSTLHLLKREDQALAAATEERIKFVPHYDTLIKSGMYEYYASEGQTPLPYALAELIDNSLSATAKNTGLRTIEIRMVFDDTFAKPTVIILDNGCGMTSKQLQNWAVYRLSKFSREKVSVGGKDEGYVRPDPVHHSLNSDISFFGVGGKQAVFFIGNSTRMITKSVGSPDVHELFLSKEEFERKERDKEDVYSSIIKNRMPGDSSHVKKSERILHNLIAEESGKESFTAVVITGVLPQHIAFLKNDFKVWTRQLANIYHYYIHGVEGKDMSSGSTNSNHPPKIDIQISLCEKPPKLPRVMNLREVDDDMQTLYINAAVDTFEFNATPKDGSTVEGLIRYHPFLYDKETYPKDPDALLDDDDDDGYDNESGAWHQAREKGPIFDCFWNGRLIPYTKVPAFDWCTSKGANELAECYSRISGVLFSDDAFKVTTNKLTFMDLEMKLKQKDTFFTRIVNSQTKRGNIKTEFTQWLKNCHEKWDKQVKFQGYTETITRTDITPKKRQHPWATFSSIEWDGKIYKAGQLVKSQKTVPILHGRVVRFLLHGKYDDTVFATGGEVEVVLEPKAFYDEIKTIAISKIDKYATDEAIKNYIDNDATKLPECLTVDWPEGNPWPQNAARPAGTQFGPLKVEILNKKRESISMMPAVSQRVGKKLLIELKVIQHGPKADEEYCCYSAQHSGKWGFWFKKMRLTDQGKYTLSLTTKINETNATAFGGRELPSFKLHFTINAGCAETFVVGEVSTTLQVGVPFNIPLLIKDGYGHSVGLPPDLKPVLKCSGLDLSYERVDNHGTTFTIKRVKARGRVLNYQQSKTYDLKVTLPGLKTDTQTINICLLPGNPHSLRVTPEDDPIAVENGNPVTFNVEIHDEAGNITAHPKQIVCCQIEGFPSVSADCSTTGAGQLVTKPVKLKIINGEPQNLKVKFEVPSQKKILFAVRQLKVLPSTRVSRMELFSNEDLVLTNNETIDWLAGGSLENLFYKLYDEADREVSPTAEIASMIKVNWTGDVYTEDLVKGKLPALQVSTQVQPALFYQVSYQDQNVSVSFYIVPCPDEPKQLKATLLQNTVKLGEILSGNINLELVDQYDNVTKALTSSCKNQITVEAEGLDKSTIAFGWQESSHSVLVTGVQFQSGPLGPRELSFTYRSFVQRVIVKVTAGVPAQLKLISGPEKPLQVLNDHGIATPFLVQLFDEWGNPTTDQRIVVILSSSSPTLKVTTAVTSQPVNAEGNASFTVSSVSGPKGYYQLEFKVSLNQKPIPGPIVNLTVIPDPNKPVSLLVEYNPSAVFPAGGLFPVFSVTVVSDEGSPMTTFNPAAVSMWLWKGEPSGNAPPRVVTELKCSKPMQNEKNDRFHFRDKDIPECVGKYTIQFSLQKGNQKVLFSTQIPLSVVANQPVKLGPDSQPSPPVVSNSKVIANRTLVENMTLRIMDSYGNPAGQDLDGKLVVSMKNVSGDGNKKLPLFEGKTDSLTIRLVKGKAHIPRLVMMENSPGERGSEYILLFKPEVLMVMHLMPFELPFYFSNDAEKQQKMLELSKKKNELTTTVNAGMNLVSVFSELLELLTNQQLFASQKEIDLRNDLNKLNLKIAQTIPDVDRLLKEKEAEADVILKTQKRVFSIPDPYSGQPDVLGMVGHLAFVQDDDAARVISWHIRGDMDCVITKTIAAARSIYDYTNGTQQVMALDSVYLPPGDRPMPHIRNGLMLFDPPGNPLYARDLLQCPNDSESCKIAFKNILGDTILIDDLDSANTYRKAVVQNKQPCPSILTRQGDRVSAKGKFGGAQNKAPINMLQVFGAPIPQHYYTLKQHIDLLSKYRSALEKRDRAVKERDDHLNKIKSPENMKRQQELDEKKKQLEEIEKQLVSSPVRPVKRGLEGAGEPPSITSKRPK